MQSVVDFYFGGNADDCHNKLVNCFGKYEDKWVYFMGYPDLLVSEYIELGTKDRDFKRMNFRKVKFNEISFGPYPLGMCELLGGGVVFLSRKPVRKNQIGLRQDNLGGEWIYMPENSTVSSFWRAVWDDNATPLLNTFLGKYATFKEAAQTILDGKAAKPFDSEFCLVRATRYVATLKYHASTIGEADLKSGVISLYPSSFHMKERLAKFSDVVLAH